MIVRRIATLGLIASSLCLTTAYAAEPDGVTCPNGTDAKISNGNKTLVCEKKEAITLASGCLGVMDPKGSDTCLPAITGARTPSGPIGHLPLVHPPLSEFKRKVSENKPDTFEAEKVTHVFPNGKPIPYGGNAANGVTCPSGFDGDKTSNNRGIRCDQVERNNVAADCDFGWTLRVDDLGNPRDKCIGINGAGATKPRGITKVQFDIEEALPNVNWILDTKAGPDSWKKKLYAYPRSN